MFDTLVVKPERTVHTAREVTKNVNITKPSTAEDLNLLRDMREKLQDEYIGMIKLDSVDINAEAHVWSNLAQMSFDVVMKTTINGREITERGSVQNGFKKKHEKIEDIVGEFQKLTVKAIRDGISKNLKFDATELKGIM